MKDQKVILAFRGTRNEEDYKSAILHNEVFGKADFSNDATKEDIVNWFHEQLGLNENDTVDAMGRQTPFTSFTTNSKWAQEFGKSKNDSSSYVLVVAIDPKYAKIYGNQDESIEKSIDTFLKDREKNKDLMAIFYGQDSELLIPKGTRLLGAGMMKNGIPLEINGAKTLDLKLKEMKNVIEKNVRF